MIKPLNVSRFEEGLKNYVAGRIAAGGVTVPSAVAEAAVVQVVPEVITGVTLEKLEVTVPSVAVISLDVPKDVIGVYADRVRIQIVAVTPWPVAGITLEDHRALFDVLIDCFPERPPTNAVPADVTAWAALEAEFSSAVLAEAGYKIQGWAAIGGKQAKGKDRVEQILEIRPCIVHPDLV
ncbi:MAG: hypothetical protein QM496_13920 [Verrucomicrobiota bacterium]